MRILDLTLDCYGPFNGLRLQFDPLAKIHIVHGANEAGKSSALAAIGDLFYGAPRREKIGFLRPKDLRLGATIKGRNGQILQFFRRRGDRNTLLDALGAALLDDALAPFLGAASRDIFHRAFGLDARGLREGANEMLRAEGEIGASLFAAASGLRNLIDLRASLEQEAEKIFDKSKAAHRSFYQALSRHDAARAEEKAATLSEATLKALREEIAQAGEKIAAIEEAERQAQAERLRLERLRKAAPILKTLAACREHLAGFDDLAGFSPEWARQWAALLEAEKAAGEQAARAREALEAARLESEEATFDAGLLARAEGIEDIVRASGAYEKSLADLPRRETAAREARQALIFRAQTCGLNGPEDLRAALPDAAALSRAEKTAARGRGLLERKAEQAQNLAEEERRFALLRAEQPAPTVDAATLREKLAAFGGVANWDESWRESALACAEKARLLAEKCARLTPAMTSLDLFAQNPSPDAARIEQAAQALDELEARERAARQQALAADESLAAAQAQLRALERLGAVASFDALREARDHREAEWLFLRSLLDGQAAADPAVVGARAGQYEMLVGEADRRADALLTDAARVAAAEAEREKIAAALEEQRRAGDALAVLARERAGQQAQWAQDWRASGIAANEPRKMMVWRKDADALLEDRESAARQQGKADEWRQRLAATQPGLEALASECGLASLPLDGAALARRIEARIAEIAKAQEAAREARAKIADGPARIARIKERLDELTAEEAIWREEWQAALKILRLEEDATFDEAQARIVLWRALPGEVQDDDDKAQRVVAIANDIAEFERKLDALLALCARDLPSRPALAAVAQLRKNLTRAREQAALRERAERAMRDAAQKARESEEALARAGAALQSFGEAAGFSGAPCVLAERLDSRELAAAALVAERGRLALVADGFDEAILAREAEDFHSDTARIRLSEIERQSEARKNEAREIHAGLRATEGQWLKLQQSMGAEAAILQRESARAEISEQSRRWAVLKLAALLVNAGLARARDRHKDPLIARAGALFSSLTQGRYAGLDQNYGEDDQSQLLALRAGDGEKLEIAALSEGARDQLYFALRLAFLDDYAARAEAPPFIVDDIFASFDESRVAAGLQALEQASGAIQPIVFTHHAHIVAIARQELGERAQILRLDAGP
ncbi:AAA family ATPase [uncultured Rhodoblastus sp.]|uniref:AAA family ATPase n=1 Tax=uncultured Rhodoblastus sp. TaxID=543037 RepID=UPI0025FA9A81|nr:AAA family ATPase [uncultured Rhodoblastus sp.]